MLYLNGKVDAVHRWNCQCTMFRQTQYVCCRPFLWRLHHLAVRKAVPLLLYCSLLLQSDRGVVGKKDEPWWPTISNLKKNFTIYIYIQTYTQFLHALSVSSKMMNPTIRSMFWGMALTPTSREEDEWQCCHLRIHDQVAWAEHGPAASLAGAPRIPGWPWIRCVTFVRITNVPAMALATCSSIVSSHHCIRIYMCMHRHRWMRMRDEIMILLMGRCFHLLQWLTMSLCLK